MFSYHTLSKQNKQVVILYASTLLGTLLGVLSSVINTRFLDPIDYGDVRYVQNIINLIASLLLFGYSRSGSRLLALSCEEKNSKKIRGCMVIILIFASIILLIATGCNYFFHITHPRLAYLFLVSLPVCLYTLFNDYINTTAQGDNHIVRISINTLLPVLLYVPLGFIIYSSYGATSTKMILLQWGINSLVAVIVIISTKPSFKGLRSTFVQLHEENKNYGIQLYYGSLVMVATNYIAGITLGMFNEDNTNVGFYTLALTVTGPLSMLPAIIGTTYFKEFAHQSRIPDKVLKMTLLMTILSCLAFILLIHPIVKFLYSDSYSQVGVYASWLAIGYCVHGVGDMLNRYLGSHGEGKFIKNASFVCGTFKIFGFSLLVYLWDMNGALLTCVVSSIIYFICMAFYYKKFVTVENISV